ncbi:DUF2975 domain-containing protein [Sphingobacterium sp. BIGb0165]|uniref:DUF2975 domain-containing protein n=1 Tax=Sphingobacterium sp. BIGb0165 TaxID=2940615 RepID=UPI002166F8A7|nr:DUF2975 domain-containing protein [Sphingobacterium sp. BIGb0165]MCS4224519.1 Ni/Fe-hydrogenase subunit HybB-like protein [Sphingobacterium sp. BIGb0165]
MKGMDNIVFKGLYIIVWIIFIGLSIEAGAIIVNFIFSIFKPEFVGRLYQKLDLSEMYNQSRMSFYTIYFFIIALAVLKAHLFYLLIEMMHKLDLNKPFSNLVSKQITRISYFTFSIGLLSCIAQETIGRIIRKGYEIGHLTQFWTDSQAFILMAAVIYVISVIFRRGIELQNENDLTV